MEQATLSAGRKEAAERIQSRSFAEVDFAAYRAFMHGEFGPGCYHACRNYLDWLYKENPACTRGYEDFLVAVREQGQVVGCVHKMQLPWQLDRSRFRVAALHHLVVAEEFRRGHGLVLMDKAIKSEEHALTPGTPRATQSLHQFLVYLRSRIVEGCWYRSVVAPVRGALTLACQRVFRVTPRPCYFPRDLPRLWRELDGFGMTTTPSLGLMQEIAAALGEPRPGVASPVWDLEQFRWRFFHPKGPRHALVYSQCGAPSEEFALLSLGPRNGLNVGRIVEARASNAERLAALIRASKRVVRRFGGRVLMAFCADDRLDKLFRDCAWQPREGASRTYLHHRKPGTEFPAWAFAGGAGDFGFEALPVETGEPGNLPRS